MRTDRIAAGRGRTWYIGEADVANHVTRVITDPFLDEAKALAAFAKEREANSRAVLVENVHQQFIHR